MQQTSNPFVVFTRKSNFLDFSILNKQNKKAKRTGEIER
jgi:hypothetical protein